MKDFNLARLHFQRVYLLSCSALWATHPKFRRWVGIMLSYLSKHFKTVVLIALTAVAIAGAPTHRARAENVVHLPGDNPEMAAAIAKARASLPVFWKSYKVPKPSESEHLLKVRFPYGTNNSEHIWMAEVKTLPDGHYSGRFANDPEHLSGRQFGDLAEFTEADISDWMFTRNDKIVGGETIRPLLKSMPKAEAAALRARLESP
jgi:uncharacterized protein YegJ (DUF2314 family)